jgi:hypothetical protein
VLRWGIGAVAGAAIGLAGCGGHRSGSSGTTAPSSSTTTGGSTTSTTQAGGTATDAQWAALAGSLAGRVVRPGDNGYLVDVQLYDSRYDSVRPAGIAYCANPTDVQRCVGFAQDHSMAITARSGGHSYAGYSTGPGLVVDVTMMAATTVGPGMATIGAGARLIDIYTVLNARGVSIPGGSCPTVGIAGLALGGGAGVVGRAHGMTCDALDSLQIVTADGRLVTADNSTNNDLFWACRGGGGGNYGIVTSFSFTTFPTDDVALFFLTWPWAAAAQVLPAWLSWAPSGPDALWSNLLMETDPAKSSVLLQVGGVLQGPTGQLNPLLDSLVTAVGGAPASRSVELVPFAHAMYVEAGCAGLSQNACHLPTQTPGGTLTRQPSLAKSDYLTGPLGDAGVQAVVAGIDSRRSQGAKGAVGFDAYGGAINRVAPSATAFVHRNALASAQYSVPFTPSDTSATLASGQQWLSQWYGTLRPYVSGQAYQNYIDPQLANWADAYYSANLPRLRSVKATWDPDNLFHFAQSIPLP